MLSLYFFGILMLGSGSIVGQKEALPGQFPYVASLHADDGTRLCLGALLDHRFVLTTAWCWNSPKGIRKILLGYLNDVDEIGIEFDVSDAKGIITDDKKLFLILLKTPVTFSIFSHPILLADNYLSEQGILITYYNNSLEYDTVDILNTCGDLGDQCGRFPNHTKFNNFLGGEPVIDFEGYLNGLVTKECKIDEENTFQISTTNSYTDEIYKAKRKLIQEEVSLENF